MYIKHGMMLTKDGTWVENKGIRIENGKIASIGGEYAAKDGERVIDASGKYILPGMIDCHCHTGLFEQDMGVEGHDFNEASDPNTADMRGIDGFNPFDTALPEAVAAGVTTIQTGPGSGNVIGGTFTTVKTYGTIVDEMVVVPESAMKIAFGENPKRFYGQSKQKAPTTRMKIMGILREHVQKAKEYGEKEERAFDAKLEAFLPVLDNTMPLKAHCHRADDIASAIRFAKEFDLPLTLDHVTEGHLIPDYIAKSGYACIVGPSFGSRSKIELREKHFKTAGVLANAGVKVAIMTDSPVIPLDHLPLCAALAVKAGMTREDAFRAITIVPAEIIGIEERVGSIEEGKDADLCIYDKDFMDYVDARCLLTVIDGEIVHEDL